MNTQSFDDVINNVCRDLPEGWGITINLESGSGSVTLEDEDFEEHIYPMNHETMFDAIRDAVAYAISKSLARVKDGDK